MSQTTLTEFQTDPETWIARVEAGETVVLTRGDRPVAELRAVLAPPVFASGLRPYGLAKGMFFVPDDFDDPLPPDILDAFNEPTVFPRDNLHAFGDPSR